MHLQYWLFAAFLIVAKVAGLPAIKQSSDEAVGTTSEILLPKFAARANSVLPDLATRSLWSLIATKSKRQINCNGNSSCGNGNNNTGSGNGVNNGGGSGNDTTDRNIALGVGLGVGLPGAIVALIYIFRYVMRKEGLRDRNQRNEPQHPNPGAYQNVGANAQVMQPEVQMLGNENQPRAELRGF